MDKEKIMLNYEEIFNRKVLDRLRKIEAQDYKDKLILSKIRWTNKEREEAYGKAKSL